MLVTVNTIRINVTIHSNTERVTWLQILNTLTFCKLYYLLAHIIYVLPCPASIVVFKIPLTCLDFIYIYKLHTLYQNNFLQHMSLLQLATLAFLWSSYWPVWRIYHLGQFSLCFCFVWEAYEVYVIDPYDRSYPYIHTIESDAKMIRPSMRLMKRGSLH